ncbi:MAG: methionyl-tRNA formyltransferase [Planctomyces sp.]|nr:methionyl-tRNA formyltransferase [Planctomyces sp.]
MSLRILLMGTGEFAVPPFRAIIDSKHSVVGVVTQPDRTGRGHHRHVNVVKELAEPFGIPVFQPQRASSAESLAELRALQADVFIVAAYGQILKRELLAIPRLGCFNLHGSLLPRHRGAAPVQYSIWKGDEQTGVTIFRIEPALDSGPVLGRVVTGIGAEETSGELMLRLADLSAPLVLDVLDQLESGTAVEEVQDVSLVTLAPKIQKTDGMVRWEQTPYEIDCHVRAMQPWPRAVTLLVRPELSQAQSARTENSDLRCLIHQVRSVTELGVPEDRSLKPGRILLHQNRLFVATGQGLIEVVRIQAEGRKVLSGTDFMNGNPLPPGSCFESRDS